MPQTILPTRDYWMILWRNRLSRRRMIWLLPQPPPSFLPLSVTSTATHRKTEKERPGDRGCGRSQIIRQRESRSSINHSILSAAYPAVSLSIYPRVLQGPNSWKHWSLNTVVFSSCFWKEISRVIDWFREIKNAHVYKQTNLWNFDLASISWYPDLDSSFSTQIRKNLLFTFINLSMSHCRTQLITLNDWANERGDQ